jgi:hypothetical protein
MDPAERVLLQVTLDDAATADDLFATLMGEDVERAAPSSSATPATSGSWTSSPAVPRGTPH